MKDSLKKVVLGSTTVLAATAAGSLAQAATDTMTINAVVIAPVDITVDVNMSFGSFTDDGSGGTAVLDNADTITGTTGGTTDISGGVVTSGEFTLKGAIGRVVNVTAPASVTLAGTTPGVTASVFTVDGGGVDINTTPYAHTMVAATDTGLKVGATLTLPAAVAPDTYAGVATLTAVYN